MRAGTHTTVIDIARPLIARLHSVARISCGIINPRAKSRSRTIKILRLNGGWRLTVIAKNAKQEFHLFDVEFETLKSILSEKEFDTFEKNLPEI